MRVLIMRGLPGSGKSTEAQRWAKLVPGTVIVSADPYMYAGGRAFDHTQLERCHESCQADYIKTLEAKAPLVIVDNTNTKFSDITFYVQAAEKRGYAFTILQFHIDPTIAAERGAHLVPRETLDLFARRMWSERLPSAWDVWNKGKPWRPPSNQTSTPAARKSPSR